MFDKKVRYKMYKAGKNWMVAGITTVAAVMGMVAASNGNSVHADQVQTQPAAKESKDQAQSAIQGQEVKPQSSAKSTDAASASSQAKGQAASSSAASSSSQASQESSADKSQVQAQFQSSQAAASSTSTKADQANAASQSSAASADSTKADNSNKTDAAVKTDSTKAAKTDAASQVQSSSQLRPKRRANHRGPFSAWLPSLTVPATKPRQRSMTTGPTPAPRLLSTTRVIRTTPLARTLFWTSSSTGITKSMPKTIWSRWATGHSSPSVKAVLKFTAWITRH